MTEKEAKAVQSLAKPVYDALIKLGWGGWKEPKVGEWFLLPKDLLSPFGKIEAFKGVYVISGTLLDYIDFVARGSKCTIHKQGVIFIPHWEEIERILREVEYVLYEAYSSAGRYMAEINDKYQSFGNSRQEAVMRSVIALGKEIDAKSK